MPSLELDAAVRESIRDGRSLYAVDADLIDELAPDVIVTQDLCAVCAVSSGQLEWACPVGAEIVSLDPRTLTEVADSVRKLAPRLGGAAPGAEIETRVIASVDPVPATVRRYTGRGVDIAEC